MAPLCLCTCLAPCGFQERFQALYSIWPQPDCLAAPPPAPCPDLTCACTPLCLSCRAPVILQLLFVSPPPADVDTWRCLLCSGSWPSLVLSASTAQCCAQAYLTVRPPWTVAHQATLSMGFSRQEHWSGLPFPPPGDLSNPGIEPTSSALAGGFFYQSRLGAWDRMNAGWRKL